MGRYILIGILVLFSLAVDVHADTFKHRETSEVFHGFATQKTNKNETMVYVAEQEKFKPVNLGEYNITFNSSTYGVNKIHLLSIQMAAPGFQTQSILINVKINEQPVELSVSINSTEISENSIFEITYEEEIQISTTIYATFENKYLSQGDVIWFSDSISRNFTEYDDFCYNITINCDPSKLSLGCPVIDSSIHSFRNHGLRIITTCATSHCRMILTNLVRILLTL